MAVSEISIDPIILSQSFSGTTTAAGAIRLDQATGWYGATYTYLSVFAISNDYPNGLYADVMSIGKNAYWAVIREITGTIVANKTVTMIVTALKRPMP